MNACAYLRVSSAGQVDHDGIPRQLAAIQAYALAAEYKIVRVFEEQGVSGKVDQDSRPALRDMLRALHEIDCNVVIVEKMDRLARDLIVQETIIGKLQTMGVKLLSTMEPDLCSGDPSRIFIRQVLGAVAQLDRSLIVARMRVARERIRASGGRCEGRKPFGDRPGEEDVIRKIATLKDHGWGLCGIAETLNTEGIKTRSGGQWYAAQVQRVLSRAMKGEL